MKYHFYILSFRPNEEQPFCRAGATGHKAKPALLKVLKRKNPRARHAALKCTSSGMTRYGGSNCVHAA